MFTAIFFVFGAIIGSFLNVVVFRLGTGESIVFGRSRCFSCGTTLKWYELIPLGSFLIQNGRCRTCRSRISPQYAIVEFFTGMVIAGVLMRSPVGIMNINDLALIAAELVFWATFIALVAYDLRHKILPDILLAILAVAAFGFRALSGELTSSLIIAGVLAGFFALLWLISRGRWMGLGDAKLFFGAGLFLGWPLALLSTLLSFWSGALVGVALMTLKRKITMKTELPFAPYIFFGALIARFWGEAILNWYLGMV